MLKLVARVTDSCLTETSVNYLNTQYVCPYLQKRTVWVNTSQYILIKAWTIWIQYMDNTNFEIWYVIYQHPTLLSKISKLKCWYLNFILCENWWFHIFFYDADSDFLTTKHANNRLNPEYSYDWKISFNGRLRRHHQSYKYAKSRENLF